MRSVRWIACFVAAALCACVQPVSPLVGADDSGSTSPDSGSLSDGGASWDAGSPSDAGICAGLGCPCQLDSECGDGAVCEPSQAPCDARSKRCMHGCHLSLQCASGESCAPRICLTCPCPGACTANGICQGSPACAHALDCSPGASTCQSGCCAACPEHAAPSCGQGECAYPGGLSPEGCPGPPLCAPCPTCPSDGAPVCTTRYATLASECVAQAIGQGMLHEGACLPGEGVACGASDECRPGQYCRPSCRMCQNVISQTRCTAEGVCVSAQDCPAGLAPPPCAQPQWECVNHACRFSCP
jgi:hypothetical protein